MSRDLASTECERSPESGREKITGRALLALLLVMALALGIEVGLQQLEMSLCPVRACHVVGGFVRIGELGLILAGTAFFLVLWALVFFARRYGQARLWGLIYLSLLGALAFDGALLGYQFVGLREGCLLCAAVGLGLWLTLFLLAGNRRDWSLFVLGAGVWLGGFMANTLLVVLPEVPKIEQTAFLKGEQKTADQTRLHLFFSLHCGHCKELIANLAVNEVWDKAYWTLSVPDRDPEDLQRLVRIRRATMAKGNPFSSVLRTKGSKQADQLEVPKGLKEAVEKARSFFLGRDLLGVPVLIAQEGLAKEVTLTGVGTIISYLSQQGLLEYRLDQLKGKPPKGNDR